MNKNQNGDRKLADVLDITSGFAFKSQYFNDSRLGLPLIRCRDINTGLADIYYSGEYDNRFVVRNGDLLVSMDGDFRVVRWSHGDALLNQRVCRLEPKEKEIDSNYLYYFLPKKLDEIHATTSFATVKHLSAKKLREVEIPLPPLSEQKRIADILDKADGIRRKRAAAIGIVDDIVHSSFLATVGPASPEYSNWPVHELQELAADENGSMRTGPFGSDLRHSEFVDDGVAVLGIDNAVQNRFAWGERRFITHNKYERLRRYTVCPGDVLITIMATLGRSSVVPEDIPLAINTKHLACITLNREKAEPEFVSNAIHRHPYILAQLGVRGRGAIMDGLNLGIIRELKIPLPPIDVQNRFTSVLQHLRQTESNLCAAKTESDNLFTGMVQRAFRGDL